RESSRSLHRGRYASDQLCRARPSVDRFFQQYHSTTLKEITVDSAQALAVVRSLANGVDPESGEVFPPESSYQRAQIVRALYEAATALERIERFDRRKAQMPAKTGEPWSEDEDRKLLA